MLARPVRAGLSLLVLALSLGGLAGTAAGADLRRPTPRPAVVPPPVHGVFSYQIGGAFTPAPKVDVVSRDRRAPAAGGLYNICYINAFQTQPAETRWWRRHHRRLLLYRGGRPVIDRTWNEQLLDTSTPAKRRALLRILGGWIDGCARAGYRAIEPDNLDSWDRSKGAITTADNMAFSRMLIARAHARGLAIAQKNAGDYAQVGRRLGFDFAVAEECQHYEECDNYMRAYGRNVIEIEYPALGGLQGAKAACRAHGDQISIVYRDRGVSPAGQDDFLEKTCDQLG
jgi:hypothetical protein